MNEETVNEEAVNEEAVNEETATEEIVEKKPNALQEVAAAVAAVLDEAEMKPERIQWDQEVKEFKTRNEAVAYAEKASAAFFAEARASKGRFSFQTLIRKVATGFLVVLRAGGPRALLARFRQTFLGPKA